MVHCVYAVCTKVYTSYVLNKLHIVIQFSNDLW